MKTKNVELVVKLLKRKMMSLQHLRNSLVEHVVVAQLVARQIVTLEVVRSKLTDNSFGNTFQCQVVYWPTRFSRHNQW